jgi:hypothetical protein
MIGEAHAPAVYALVVCDSGPENDGNSYRMVLRNLRGDPFIDLHPLSLIHALSCSYHNIPSESLSWPDNCLLIPRGLRTCKRNSLFSCYEGPFCAGSCISGV